MRDLEFPGRSPVHAPQGMACTSHPLSSQVAIDVLKSGGNAVDAAVAACAVQCVVEPGSTGIGGDCFCLYAPKGGADLIAFNGSGRSPAAADAQWYADEGITELPQNSPHAVTVPSEVELSAIVSDPLVTVPPPVTFTRPVPESPTSAVELFFQVEPPPLTLTVPSPVGEVPTVTVVLETVAPLLILSVPVVLE